MHPFRATLVLLASLELFGCGHVTETDTIREAGTEGGVRADGCPTSPESLEGKCTEPGKRCPYTENCTTGGGALLFECHGPLPPGTLYSNSWEGRRDDCYSYLDPQGCPLGPPLVESSCARSGLECWYYPAL